MQQIEFRKIIFQKFPESQEIGSRELDAIKENFKSWMRWNCTSNLTTVDTLTLHTIRCANCGDRIHRYSIQYATLKIWILTPTIYRRRLIIMYHCQSGLLVLVNVTYSIIVSGYGSAHFASWRNEINNYYYYVPFPFVFGDVATSLRSKPEATATRTEKDEKLLPEWTVQRRFTQESFYRIWQGVSLTVPGAHRGRRISLRLTF